jgi:hypothetical protein
VRRERTYSDPRVISFITDHFIPAAVNINHLQRQEDAEGELFRTISWQGRFKRTFEEAKILAGNPVRGECHQGQYVASVDGELFGTRHTSDPDQLLQMMHKALVNWQERATQKDRREIEDTERDGRHEWSYPEGGLVLQLGCRDLLDKSEAPDEWQFNAHNQNYVWLTREEIRSIVPEDVSVGDQFDLPEAVHRRLVRYHFLDIVRGETPPWPQDAPDRVRLTLECILKDDSHVSLKLTGGGLLVESGDWCSQPVSRSVYRRGEMCCAIVQRGFDSRVLGHLTYDLAEKSFTRFDVVAVGTRWGGTTFNFRQEDVEPAGMGMTMTIAGSHERDRTPPASSPSRYFAA